MRNKKGGEEKRQWLYSLVFFFAGKSVNYRLLATVLNSLNDKKQQPHTTVFQFSYS